MNYISLIISLVSIAISVFTFWKTLYDERQRQNVNVVAVHSPENLVSPKMGVVYLELLITNNSTLPLVLISSTMNLKKTSLLKRDLTTSAYLFDTLISTRRETSGSTTKKQTEKTSDGLPLTINPRDALHCVLAYPAEDVMGIDKETTELDFIIQTNRKEDIRISSKQTKPKMTSTVQLLKERLREA